MPATKSVAKDNFTIRNMTKGKVPSLPFVLIAKKVLPKNYELSLVFIADKKSQNLNRIYREKNKPTNVLAFPIDKNTGEIFINLNAVKREAKKFEMNEKKFIGYLFIHGILHLKGFSHGSTMERTEKKLMKQFKI